MRGTRAEGGPRRPAAHDRARISVALVFLIHGIAVSNWMARIPAVQRSLHLSSAALGLALLAASGGAFVTMTAIAPVISRVGSARATAWSSYGLCAALPLPALAWSAPSLAAALVVYGAFVGAMDVAMNTQAVDVERGLGRPVMSRLHALFSLGGFVGSAAGGLAAGRGLAPFPHLTAAAAILAIATAAARRHLLVDDPAILAQIRVAPFPLRPLLALGAIAFCILLGEGAMGDWSAVYLSQYAGQGAAATGYATFSIAMAVGRFGGDALRTRLGAVRVVRIGSALAALGLGGGLAYGGLAATLVGFACAGLGFSSVFPIALSAAGHKSAPVSQAGVATVAATGYVAMLVGPPLIGGLAQLVTLRAALGVTVALSLLAAALAGFVRSADAETAPTVAPVARG